MKTNEELDGALAPLMADYTEWDAERSRIDREEPHSRRMWEASDDAAIELLRAFAVAVGLILADDGDNPLARTPEFFGTAGIGETPC